MKLKWTIHELVKKAKNDNLIEGTLDLRKFLSSEVIDLLDISSTKVAGKYYYNEIENIFSFHLNIDTELKMLCSLSFETVPVNLNFYSQINFSVNYIDDDTHVINGITIDLAPYIFAEILIEKPMRVIASNAKIDVKQDLVKLTDEEKEAANPFAKLKK